jgi:drug/metabolite transporter (DMT)-like permease
VGTFLGIWLNQLGLDWAEFTGVATVLNAMTPVYLIPLSALFLAEPQTSRAWVATLVALAGIAIMTFT